MLLSGSGRTLCWAVVTTCFVALCCAEDINWVTSANELPIDIDDTAADDLENSIPVEPGQKGGRNGRPSTSPAPPVTPSQANEIYRMYKFFSIYEPATFSLCYHQFFDQCIPALQNTTQWARRWRTQKGVCFTRFCNCLPNSKLYSDGNCSFHWPHRMQSRCAVREKCTPMHSRCYQTFILGAGNLPSACTSFLSCAAQESVQRADYIECLDSRQRSTPFCNNQQICQMISGSGYAPDDTSGDEKAKSKAMAIVTSVIVLCAVTLVCWGAVVGYRYRREARDRRRLDEEEVGVQLHETRSQVPEVGWFGDRVRIEGQSESVDASAEAGEDSTTQATKSSCTLCGAVCNEPHARFLLLPCHCQWCGQCNAELKTSLEKSASSGKKYPMCSCGDEIVQVVDLHKLYLGDSSSVSVPEAPEAETDGADENGKETDQKTGESSSSQLPPAVTSSDSLDGSTCSICMDTASNVVFLPCGHVGACSICAHRMVHTPMRVRGRYVAPRCHLCRASVTAACVLPPAALKVCQQRRTENGQPNVK